MKTYEKHGLTFLEKNDDLYVTADSFYKKLEYDNSNKQRWYQTNIAEKYIKGEDFFYDINHGLCVQCEILEEVCSNIKYNISRSKALADLISIEYHDFVKNHEWIEEVNEYDEAFYKENIQPKVSAALESITKTAETPFFDPKNFSGNFQVFSLPDELVINGKKYVCKERYEQDMVSLQFKMDALKSILEK